jgi:lipid II:glycine glycyltransferase (peptidoglycan interpeptide bridge formation enzyme)
MGIEIIKTNSSEYLDVFWEIMMDTVKRQKWTFYSYEYIKNELEIFGRDDQNLMFLAKYQGKFISAAMFNFYNDQSVYHHSGSLSKYRNIPASYLIQWEAIKEAKRRGLKRHNFWGLPLTKTGELDMHDPWTGVGLFKVGFGGRAQSYIHARDIPVSPKYRLTYLYEKLENLKRTITGRSN